MKVKYSRKVLDLKRRIEALTNQRKYEDANKFKLFLEQLEEDEKAK
jgi:hypothetical protein